MLIYPMCGCVFLLLLTPVFAFRKQSIHVHCVMMLVLCTLLLWRLALSIAANQLACSMR
jgi:hypothetical protein